jgi:5-oxoprolinase (ATP-hydrolysing) subunit A
MMGEHYVDLNCDLGESYGPYRIGQDSEVMKYITSANIACGYHAGDHNVIQKTIQKAVENGVGLGSHPGFMDLHGFGRREIRLNAEELYNLIVYQIGAVQAFAKINNSKLNHVKPHGALYNMACRNQEMAETIAQAVFDVDAELILYGLAGSELIHMGKKVGLKVAEEVFADRTYQPDGTLTSRNLANAMITDPDEAVARILRIVQEEKVEAVDGSDIPIQADTICVHGDSEKSLEFVKKLNKELTNNGITLKRVGM